LRDFCWRKRQKTDFLPNLGCYKGSIPFSISLQPKDFEPGSLTSGSPRLSAEAGNPTQVTNSAALSLEHPYAAKKIRVGRIQSLDCSQCTEDMTRAALGQA